MFQVGFYLLPGTGLWPVSFNKRTRQQNEEAFFQKYSWRAARMFSQCFPVCPTGRIVPSVTVAVFQFPNFKLCLRCTAGNFNENPSLRGPCERLQKFGEHEQGSTPDLIFESNSSKGQILRACTFK